MGSLVSSDPHPAGAGDTSELIADRVQEVPGVHGLHGGVFGQVGTYLPGRRVTGVRHGQSGWDIHLVLTAGAPLVATTEAVRAAARTAGATGPVDVVVEDVTGAEST